MKHKFVKVIWHDIAGISGDDNGAWMSKKFLEKKGQELFDSEYVSVGTIIADTKKYIVIAATADGDESFADASMIPKSVIISITPLK